MPGAQGRRGAVGVGSEQLWPAGGRQLHIAHEHAGDLGGVRAEPPRQLGGKVVAIMAERVVFAAGPGDGGGATGAFDLTAGFPPREALLRILARSFETKERFVTQMSKLMKWAKTEKTLVKWSKITQKEIDEVVGIQEVYKKVKKEVEKILN